MITPQQREMRRKYIGSSDTAAILGLDPFKSAEQVWLEKTGRLEDDKGNENTRRGNLLEPAILNWAELQLGPFIRNELLIAPDKIRAANLDGFMGAVDRPFIVEAKSTTQSDEYGEKGTDQVPERVSVQTHHQLDVAGPNFEIAYVPVLMPVIVARGRAVFDFRMYQVIRNPDLVEIVALAATGFYEKFIKTDTKPDDFRPSLDVLKRVRRTPNKSVPIGAELFDAWIVAKAKASEADDDVKEAQRALLTELDDAEAGNLPDGRIITYLESKRSGYTVAESKFRQLRVVKATAKQQLLEAQAT